jgi:hypothetical protein
MPDEHSHPIGQMVDRITRALERLLDGDLSAARACLIEAGARLDDAITGGTQVPWLLEDEEDGPVVVRLDVLVRRLTEKIERAGRRT